MENASKALLMAGGILIAILVLSLGVYLFTTYSKVGTTYDNTIESNEKIKFNTNFTKFEGRTDITAQEIVSIVNFAKDYEESNQIKVNVTAEDMDKSKLIDFITKSNELDTKFTVKKGNISYDSYGRVNGIKFDKINN